MDKIEIKKLMVMACHGVYEEEKKIPQRFFVSADLYLDMSAVAGSDKISDTAHYGHIMQFISSFLVINCFNLIETLAIRLSRKILLNYPVIKKVVLTVDKPDAPVKLSFETVSVTVKREWTRVAVSLGSNLGDRELNLQKAVGLLEKDEGIKNIKLSSLLETEPFECTENHGKYVNQCAVFETLYTPSELLELTQSIEKSLGRQEKGNVSPRTADIDILLFGESIKDEETPFGQLTIPHKDMHRRAFVLDPLFEIAPHMWHPKRMKTVSELLADLKQS